MSYFSTLTDIVTCNLSEILANEADPEAAIEQIIYEIQEGVSGALRARGRCSFCGRGVPSRSRRWPLLFCREEDEQRVGGRQVLGRAAQQTEFEEEA